MTRGYISKVCLAACLACAFRSQAQVKLNEVLASNLTIAAPDSSITDWVELVNTSAQPVNLAGFALSDSATPPAKWSFPSGISIPANGFLVVLLDPDRAPSTTPAANLNAGFALKANGDNIFLLQNGARIDSLTFGLQLGDLSLGRVPDGGDWQLATPTPGKANSGVTLAASSGLKVNEWMASPSSGDDWFEVYNPATAPVLLSGLFLTDASALPTQYAIPALSFIGTGDQAYIRFWADNSTNKGAEHVNFKLSGSGEAVGIFTSRGSQVDYVTFGQQTADVSQGRLPDGSPTIVSFSGSATPGAPNFIPYPGLVVNELLSHTDPPIEDAVEFYNKTAAPIDISGWFLSNKKSELKHYQIPANTIVPAKGYAVIYEYQFGGPTAASPFTFNSAHGDQVYLSQAVNGQLTGYQVTEVFEAAEHGYSFGRYETSVPGDYKFVAMSHLSFGVDDPLTVEQFRAGTGEANPAPRVGPIVINEIMFQPQSLDGITDNTLDEYIELQNITSLSIPLFDTAHPENRWKLQSAVAFTFPPGTIIAPLATALVVSFDPVAAPAIASSFRSRFNVPTQVPLYGPYSGKLSNGGDPIELYKPDTPQEPPHPDVGFVPYIRVDKINYNNAAPWPTGAGGSGKSLQRKSQTAFGNDPINWATAAPTAGRANSSQLTDTDADGIPDSWETANGLNPADPSDAAKDPDNDGMSNLQEYLAGTDPHNQSSVLKIDQIISSLGANIPLKLHFNAAADKSYTIQYRNSFAPTAIWQKLTNVTAQSTTRTVEVTDDKTVGRTDRYYRLVTPATD